MTADEMLAQVFSHRFDVALSGDETGAGSDNGWKYFLDCRCNGFPIQWNHVDMTFGWESEMPAGTAVWIQVYAATDNEAQSIMMGIMRNPHVHMLQYAFKTPEGKWRTELIDNEVAKRLLIVPSSDRNAIRTEADQAEIDRLASQKVYEIKYRFGHLWGVHVRAGSPQEAVDQFLAGKAEVWDAETNRAYRPSDFGYDDNKEARWEQSDFLTELRANCSAAYDCSGEEVQDIDEPYGQGGIVRHAIGDDGKIISKTPE